MSGDTGQYNQDTGLASPESEASSRTTSRRPTQSGSNLTSDKPRPPWKNTTPTPKLLEATRKVLKVMVDGTIQLIKRIYSFRLFLTTIIYYVTVDCKT